MRRLAAAMAMGLLACGCGLRPWVWMAAAPPGLDAKAQTIRAGDLVRRPRAREFAGQYVELELTVENRGSRAVVIAPEDVTLVDRRGLSVAPADTIIDFGIPPLAIRPLLCVPYLNMAAIGVWAVAVQASARKAGAGKSFEDQWNARLTTDLMIPPGATSRLVVFFPPRVNLKRLAAVRIWDSLAGRSREVPLRREHL